MNYKKLLVDFLTVLLLAAAFGIAYYTGLVGKNTTGEPMIDIKVFGLIAVGGTLILMAVGSVAELISRVKNDTVTWSFTAFMAAQVVAFVGMCALVIGIVSGAFATDSAWIRGLFLSFAATEILGYVQSVIYANTLDSYTEESEEADEVDLEDDEDYEDEEYSEEEETEE